MDAIKKEFSTKLISAIAEKSSDALYEVCNNYHDMQNLGLADIEHTEAKMQEIILKNCRNYLGTVDFDISRYNLESVLIKGDKEALALIGTGSPVFTDSVDLLFTKEGSDSRLSLKIPYCFIINNQIKINNPLMIKHREFEKIVPVITPNTITVTDSNANEHVLALCEKSIVQAYLEERKFEDPKYLADRHWYIHKGNLELDSLNLNDSVIVTGDLSIHEPLVNMTENIIVLGETTLNALYLGESNDVLLFGGLYFNTVLISVHSGPYRVLRDLQGPLLFNSSESTTITGINGVQCFIDNVYGKSVGKPFSIVKEEYKYKENEEYEEGMDEDDDEDFNYGEQLDEARVLDAISFNKNIFKDEATQSNFISVKKNDFSSKESIIKFLQKEANYFKELEQEYRADKEIVEVALGLRAELFKYISDDLKNDATYIYQLIERNGRLFQYLPEKFKQDRELLLLAMKTNVYALSYAHESLKADRELVLLAVNERPKILEYVDESFHSDEEVLLAVIEKDPWAFKYACPSVVNNETLMLALIIKSPNYLESSYMKGYMSNKDFLMKVLAVNSEAFNYLGDKFKKDNEIREIAGRVSI